MARFFWKKDTDSGLLTAIGQTLEAGILAGFWRLMGSVSLIRAHTWGYRLGYWLGPRTAKQRWVVANLRTAFPERPANEIALLARRVWANFGAVLAEFPHLSTLVDASGPDPAVEIVCEHPDPDFLLKRPPSVFVAAHMGNWELSAYAIRRLGFPVDVVYGPQTNPRIETMLQAVRTPLGCGFIPKRHLLRVMLRNLRQGRSVGMHVDVRADGEPDTPFFGVPAPTTRTPAWVARQASCEIVPVRCERLAPGRYRVTLHPPLAQADAQDPHALDTTTRELNRRIAGLITQDPGQWWCAKRRWPKSTMGAVSVESTFLGDRQHSG